MNHASLTINYQKARAWLRGTAAVTLMLTSAGCVGMQRMERAVVTIADGVPCFSIPQKWETRNGVPLYGISVGELTSADWKSSPRMYWGMAIEAPDNSILLSPQNCLRYGNKPDNVAVSMAPARPLNQYEIYKVSINARPKNSSVAYYTAEFCLKPGADGKTTVQVVPPNRNDPNRNAVCAKP